MVKDLRGKTAFVTGAAHGIGQAIAAALASSGANLAIADIDAEALETARAALEADGATVLAMPLDVSDQAAVDEVADRIEAAFGAPQVLVNNAGITLGPIPVTEIDAKMWEWIFGVNLFGVVNGVRAFVPRMLATGEEGHVVNTASIGGLQVNAELQNGSYSMTKYAVVALSEALQLQLARTAIGVSVLCPALVRTTLRESAYRRPERFGGPYGEVDPAQAPEMPTMQPAELQPAEVGARVLAAIRDGDFYIFTHPETRAWIESKHERLMEGYDSLDRYLRR